MREKILIIEDDDGVIDALNDILIATDYEVKNAKNREETFKTLETHVDLVLLDVHLDKENGFDLCKDIRKEYDVPIIFLTACDSEMEIVRGFKAGADDYITKPFRVQELLVRIQAILKRVNNKVYTNSLFSGDLEYIKDSCCIKKSGKLVEITLVEWKIISKLIARWPQVVRREELLFSTWDKDAVFVEENTLNVNISRIRDKLGKYKDKAYIETVRGIGYRWVIPVEH